jgi:hypothetical protein
VAREVKEQIALDVVVYRTRRERRQDDAWQRHEAAQELIASVYAIVELRGVSTKP